MEFHIIVVKDDEWSDIIACGKQIPDGYEVFDGTKTSWGDGTTYMGQDYGFNPVNADENNVITRDVTLENKAKTFSVSVTKKRPKRHSIKWIQLWFIYNSRNYGIRKDGDHCRFISCLCYNW